MRFICRAFLSLVLILGASVPALAQVDRATLTGSVQDPSGAAVPDVAITVTNEATHAIFSLKSNAQGFYTLPNLPIATYTLKFEATGFKTLSRRGVALQVGQRAQIDVRVQVGSVDQVVEVTGAPVLTLQTETGTNLTNEVIANLPLTANGGRDITAFAFSITPTVTGDTYTSHVGGSQAFSKEVLIDGTSSDSGIVGQVAESSPSMDAVEQFQINTSGITAAASRSGGGAFLFSLKSGTNSVHGSVFGFLGNEFLNANSWTNDYFRSLYSSQNPSSAASINAQYRKPKNRYFDYGGSVGGPLWKNKMFLFAAFERYTQQDLTTTEAQQSVPTAAFLSGDFSALVNTSAASLGKDSAGNTIYPGAIWDPRTGNVFVGNKIPISRFSSTAKAIIPLYQQYYAPTVAGALVNNYPRLNNQTQARFHQTQLSLKYDWDVSRKDRLVSSYIYTLRPRLNNSINGAGGLFQRGSDNGGPLTRAGQQTTIGNAYRVSDAHTFTPNLLNVISFTFNQFQNKTIPATALTSGTNYAQQLGLPGVDSVSNFPVITFGSAVNGIGETTIGNSNIPGSGYVAYNGILNEQLTWTKGKHTIQAGFEARAIGLNNNARGGQLHYNFSEKTGTPNNSSIQSKTGFGFANFLLGDVYSASLDTPFNQYGRRKEYAVFAEDTVKVTSKLTIDVALRWDIPRPQHEKYGHWSNFTATASNPSFGATPGSIQYLSDGSQTFETRENLKQFSPHLGAAYQLTPKMVIRGAYGLYYVPLGNNTYGAVPYASTVGYQAENQVRASTVNGSKFNWDSGYPGTSTVASRDLSSSYIPYGPASVDPNTLTMGYTQNYNVGFQYEFAKNTKIEVSYIGNIGRKLHDSSLNPLNYPTWATYSKLYNSYHVYDYIYDSYSAQAAGVPYPYSGFYGSAYQAINPYPQVAATYGPVYFVNSPLGKSEYNAFVIEVTRRMSHGLSMDLSYALSRSQGNSESAFVDTYASTSYRQDPYRYRAASENVTSFDATHQVKGYVNYELPFGKGKRFLSGNRLIEAVAGGWLVGAVLNYRSGAPISAVYAQNYYPGWTGVYANIPAKPNFTNTFKKVNLTWNPATGGDNGSLFVDPTQFSNPTDGQLGNSPDVYSGWRNWAYLNEDISLLKTVYLGKGERFPLTLRAEFYDVFNRHHNNAPNLTFGSPYFGHVTGVSGNRTGQLGARFQW